MFNISIPVAFLAGLVSFLSPCVLPIIPGFLAYLAGTATSGKKQGQVSSRLSVFYQSLWFVIGFSVVFALIGVLLNTVLSHVAYSAEIWFARIGGTIIIIFGLYLTGLLDISFLERAYTMRVGTNSNRPKFVTSFLFGFAFAAGWTPCVGATLGAIITLAATHPGSAFSLLFSYALGLGVPFLIVGLFTNEAAGFFERHATVFNWISKIFGGVLIIIGILVFTNELSKIASFDFVNAWLLK
jgi:cytochrome c-type biogenesis protein